MNKEIKDIITKQNEKIEEIRDVMLWRTKEFKAMIVSTEIANSKAKALESHLSKYILEGDEADERAVVWRDKKIKEQAQRIKLLENTEQGWIAAKMYKEELRIAEDRIKELESLQVFHTEESYDEDPEMYDESFMEDPRDYPEEQ